MWVRWNRGIYRPPLAGTTLDLWTMAAGGPGQYALGLTGEGLPTMSRIQVQVVNHITLVGSPRQSAIDFWEGLLGMRFLFEQPNLGKQIGRAHVRTPDTLIY